MHKSTSAYSQNVNDLSIKIIGTMMTIYNSPKCIMNGLRALHRRIVTIWKMRNPSILSARSAKIWPITSVYSAIQGFDWVLVPRIVCINSHDLSTKGPLREYSSWREPQTKKNLNFILIVFFLEIWIIANNLLEIS